MYSYCAFFFGYEVRNGINATLAKMQGRVLGFCISVKRQLKGLFWLIKYKTQGQLDVFSVVNEEGISQLD